MGNVVDASELNRLEVDFGLAGQMVGGRVALVVKASAARIEAEAKAFCPVDTGFLRSSIGRDIDPDGLGAEIGPTASYGHFVEFGTARMAPEAYMGPAFDRAQPDFIAGVLQAAVDATP